MIEGGKKNLKQKTQNSTKRKEYMLHSSSLCHGGKNVPRYIYAVITFSDSDVSRWRKPVHRVEILAGGPQRLRLHNILRLWHVEVQRSWFFTMEMLAIFRGCVQ